MEQVDPLFKNRVPEAAARQLAVVLAWVTECQLATLEQLQSRKTASKADLKRQQEICDKAVDQCRDLGVQPKGVWGRDCPRLTERLAAAGAAP